MQQTLSDPRKWGVGRQVGIWDGIFAPGTSMICWSLVVYLVNLDFCAWTPKQSGYRRPGYFINSASSWINNCPSHLIQLLWFMRSKCCTCMYLWDSQNLFQVPTSNKTSDFPRVASLLTFPQWMTTNHIFLTCAKIISWLISLWSLCVSAYCHCVEDQDHVSWQRCLPNAGCSTSPFSCVAKDHQPVTGPQGTVHAGKILERLYSSNMPFEKNKHDIQKFKGAFHVVQYNRQNSILLQWESYVSWYVGGGFNTSFKKCSPNFTSATF